MYETHAFRSGIFAILLLLPIVLPMRFSFFRNKVRALYIYPEKSGPSCPSCMYFSLFEVPTGCVSAWVRRSAAGYTERIRARKVFLKGCDWRRWSVVAKPK